MMPVIRDAMFAVSNSLTASILAKMTVITTLGLFAAWVARGKRAAIRHALLAATFGVTMLLPIAAVLVPPFHIGVPVDGGMRSPLLPVAISGVDVPVHPAPTPVEPNAPVPVQAPRETKISLQSLLLAGWVVGAGVFLLPLIFGLWQIRALRRSGLPWRHGQSLIEPLALDARIRWPVQVLLHEAVPGPITCGILRPAIVLPWDAKGWDAGDLHRALVHELEHVRRGDSVIRCVARTASAMYWFHPLIWVAWRKLVLEAERACDDAVLARSEATAYADQLVRLAKRLSVAERSPLLAMASRADLATRVGAVLDERQARGRAGKSAIAFACATALAIAAAVSPLALVGAPQDSDRPTFEVASVRLARPLTPEEAFPVLCYTGCRIGERIATTGDRVTLRNFVLSKLITVAYGLQAFSGLPNPTTPNRDLQKMMDTQFFDITAKIPTGVSAGRMPEMLQALLADRFKLSFHRETKQVPGYALVVGKNGSKLKLADADAEAPVPDTPGSQRFATPQGEARFDSGGWAIATGPFGPIRMYADGQGIVHHEFLKISMAQLVQVLPFLFRPVQDMTDLKGYYQFSWVQGRGRPPSNGTVSHDIPEVTPEDLGREALEKAGLNLESKTIPVEVLVIDHLETPTEN